jgi:hypothetical protein
MTTPVNKTKFKAAPSKRSKTEDAVKTPWHLVPNKAMVVVCLLWYLNNADKCKLYNNSASVTIGVHKSLRDHGLVTVSVEDDEDDEVEVWSLTPKGLALVKHIMDLPLPEPETIWSMPEKAF